MRSSASLNVIPAFIVVSTVLPIRWQPHSTFEKNCHRAPRYCAARCVDAKRSASPLVSISPPSRSPEAILNKLR